MASSEGWNATLHGAGILFGGTSCKQWPVRQLCMHVTPFIARWSHLLSYGSKFEDNGRENVLCKDVIGWLRLVLFEHIPTAGLTLFAQHLQLLNAACHILIWREVTLLDSPFSSKILKKSCSIWYEKLPSHWKLMQCYILADLGSLLPLVVAVYIHEYGEKQEG